MSDQAPKPRSDFSSFPVELELIYATVPIGLCVLDAQLCYVRINQAMTEMNGFSIQEHLGKRAREILPKLADFLEPQLQQIIKTGEARLNIEFSGETPAQPGVIRTWNEHWLPLKNEAGEVVAINIVAEEITERKRLTEALRQSEERFRVAFETANDAMSLSDSAGIVVAANEAYFQLYGYTADEILGHSFAVIFPEEARQQAVEQYQQVFTGQLEQLAYEATVRHKDGTERTVEARIGFVMQGNKRTAMLSVVRDFTERKQGERRQALLQKIAAALSAALTPKDVLMIVLEQGTEVLGAVAGTIYTITEDHTRLEFFANRGYGEDLIETWRSIPLDAPVPLAESVRACKPVWIPTEEDLQRRFPSLQQRSERHKAWVALPLIADAKAIGAIGFSFPTSQTFTEDEIAFMQTLAQQCAQAFERARLYEQANEAATLAERQRLARELHDVVSQSLTAATMLAESAERMWKKDPDRALEIVSQVIKHNHAAQAELRTLLWELRPEAVLKTKLNDLLKQLIQIANGRRGLHAELTCEGEDEPLSEAVHIALYRIAQECINNIVKHSHATQVQVHLRQAKEGFSLRIADNGRGFDMTQVSGGLGLGTMRERATAIHAALTITSEPGGGTVIELSWCDTTAAV